MSRRCSHNSYSILPKIALLHWRPISQRYSHCPDNRAMLSKSLFHCSHVLPSSLPVSRCEAVGLPTSCPLQATESERETLQPCQRLEPPRPRIVARPQAFADLLLQ